MIYALILLPYLFALLLEGDPIISYFTAWLGSFWIFYLTWFSPFRQLSTDLPISRQIMRPIFLVQLIFAGFMCVTSIFYLLNTLGYNYLDLVSSVDRVLIADHLTLIATCQRLSLLAHGALVCGMLFIQQSGSSVKKRSFGLSDRTTYSSFIIFLFVISFGLSFCFQLVPGLFQFSLGLTNIANISGVALLVLGVRERNFVLFIWGITVFALNLVQASLSGFKEPIIVNFLILACLFYPYYRKIVLLLSIPSIYLLFYVLPTYAEIVRTRSWAGEATANEAQMEAFETIINSSEGEIEGRNWQFLTNRLSEIDMFTQFVRNTPSKIDFYGFKILEQSVVALVPRALWLAKPDVEDVSMERVYAAGVVDMNSAVSAKTRPVVDAYLSFGTAGVFIFLFLYGSACQALSNTAERLFGGYNIGTIIVFNGLFQSLWRGNNFEFILNNMVWNFVLMLLLFRFLKSQGYLRIIA